MFMAENNINNALTLTHQWRWSCCHLVNRVVFGVLSFSQSVSILVSLSQGEPSKSKHSSKHCELCQSQSQRKIRSACVHFRSTNCKQRIHASRHTKPKYQIVDMDMGILDCARSVLRNELIIFNVFKHLSPLDLGACRLVCLLWDHEVLLHTRKRVTLNFSASHTKYIEKFVETMGPSALDPGSFPYTRFIITLWDHGVMRDAKEFCGCGPDYAGCRPELPFPTATFFVTFGPCIKHLQLSINEFEKCLEDRTHRTWLAASLPNLLELVLVGQSSIGLENRSPAPIQMAQAHDQGFGQLTSLTLVDKFGERDLDEPDRFNSRFMANVFKMCHKASELTVDTLDCKTPCSLTQSVLQALRAELETGAQTNLNSKLPNLAKLSLQAAIHIDDLFSSVSKICKRYKLVEVHAKFVEIRANANANLDSQASESQTSAAAMAKCVEDCVKAKCEWTKVVKIQEIISARQRSG